MLILDSASDKVQLITGQAATIHAHYSILDNASGTVTPSSDNIAAISTATTTDIVPSPGSSVQRNVRHLNFRNAHATASCDLTVQHTDGTDTATLFKCTLLAGEELTFDQGGRWTHYDSNGGIYAAQPKLDVCLVVSGSDVVNATTSFADVTGLTYPLLSGRKYAVMAYLFHANNASTTGSRFGYNIGAAPTVAQFAEIATVTPSATAAAMSEGSATARDTAIVAQTTGDTGVRLSVFAGYIQPSADGTFAVRCASEVAVAAGLTVKVGSWLRIREVDN
jgi:hypothetical protein